MNFGQQEVTRVLRENGGWMTARQIMDAVNQAKRTLRPLGIHSVRQYVRTARATGVPIEGDGPGRFTRGYRIAEA